MGINESGDFGMMARGRVSQVGLTNSRKEMKMGKGNNSQKNDKKNKKPKQEKAKPKTK